MKHKVPDLAHSSQIWSLVHSSQIWSLVRSSQFWSLIHSSQICSLIHSSNLEFGTFLLNHLVSHIFPKSGVWYIPSKSGVWYIPPKFGVCSFFCLKCFLVYYNFYDISIMSVKISKSCCRLKWQPRYGWLSNKLNLLLDWQFNFSLIVKLKERQWWMKH